LEEVTQRDVELERREELMSLIVVGGKIEFIG
jgi:hypothetical protein